MLTASLSCVLPVLLYACSSVRTRLYSQTGLAGDIRARMTIWNIDPMLLLCERVYVAVY